MRVLLVAALLTQVLPGSPFQGGGSGVSTSSVNSWTAQQNFSDGTANEPSIGWASDDDGTGTGLYRRAANIVTITNGGAIGAEIQSGAIALSGSIGTVLAWTSGALGTALDLRLSREAAATLQMGADVNGSAVAQTLKSHDGITGSDVAGANLTLAAGRGTGAGTSGNLIFQAASAGATGTTAQTLRDRGLVVGAAKALTTATPTPFLSIAVPASSMVGGVLEYSIQAADATNAQSRSGVIPFAVAVTSGDSETCTVGTVGAATEVVAVTSGTLTNTFTCVVTGTNTAVLNADAASSLTETTLQIVYQVRVNPSNHAVTLTPQ